MKFLFNSNCDQVLPLPSCWSSHDATCFFLHLKELEREREAKRKLESMVGSLAQEVERLKEVMCHFKGEYYTISSCNDCEGHTT